MAFFDWDGSLDIGHALIDEQHKSLVGLINELHARCCAGGGDFRPVLLRLYKYALFHFAEEEKLMRQAGYADIQAHIEKHEEFIRTLDELSEKARSGQEGVGQAVLDWLAGWLREHIAGTDSRLAGCLAK